MPISRYNKNKVTTVGRYEHDELLEKREVQNITVYSFKQFKTIKIRDIRNINIVNHIWESSDRFYKLASQYYGSPAYWWVIAYFNNKPLETDLTVGDIVEIPVPLDRILLALGY